MKKTNFETITQQQEVALEIFNTDDENPLNFADWYPLYCRENSFYVDLTSTQRTILNNQ